MTFDAAAFETARLAMPEADVPVPELARFFPAGAKPVFRVRGLKGPEWAQAEAAKRSRKEEVVAALVGRLQAEAPGKEIADKLLAALGEGPGVDPDLVKNRRILEAGCVSPKLDYKQVKRLSDLWFAVFCRLVAKIMDLSGRGPEIEGESSASGHTPGCGTPSHSAPEAAQGEGGSGSCSR